MKYQQSFITKNKIIIVIIACLVLVFSFSVMNKKKPVIISQSTFITAYNQDFPHLKEKASNIDSLFLYSSENESVLYLVNKNNKVIGIKKFNEPYSSIVYKNLNEFIIMDEHHAIEIVFVNKEIQEKFPVPLSEEQIKQFKFQKENPITFKYISNSFSLFKPITPDLSFVHESIEESVKTLTLNNQDYVLSDFDRNSITRGAIQKEQ